MMTEISEKNSEHLSYKGTPIKELNSYVKKKPEDYYKNIYKAYLDFIGADSEAGDDLTFIVLMYNG